MHTTGAILNIVKILEFKLTMCYVKISLFMASKYVEFQKIP